MSRGDEEWKRSGDTTLAYMFGKLDSLTSTGRGLLWRLKDSGRSSVIFENIATVGYPRPLCLLNANLYVMH